MSMFAKVLCPVDFSDVSTTIAEAAREIALGFGSEVLVVHVVPIGTKDQIMNLPPDLLPKVVNSVVNSAEKDVRFHGQTLSRSQSLRQGHQR